MPGIAVLTAGAVVLGPALVAPPATTLAVPAVPIPAVYIADVALVGIGRDIYNSVSAVVQGVVQWTEFVVGIVPFLGSGIRAQIDIDYFELIQPLIANTVYALSDIVADPLGIFTTVGAYASNQVYVGYTWVTKQIAFFGLPPILGPIPAPPPLASVGARAKPAAAHTVVGPRAGAALAPARVGRGELRRAARTAAAGVAAGAPAASIEAAVGQLATPGAAAVREPQGTARSARGARKAIASTAR